MTSSKHAVSRAILLFEVEARKSMLGRILEAASAHRRASNVLLRGQPAWMLTKHGSACLFVIGGCRQQGATLVARSAVGDELSSGHAAMFTPVARGSQAKLDRQKPGTVIEKRGWGNPPCAQQNMFREVVEKRSQYYGSNATKGRYETSYRVRHGVRNSTGGSCDWPRRRA